MTGNAEDTVLTADADGVRTLSLNRPKALNALDLPMAVALGEAAQAAAGDPAVRCILVKGAGKAFFAGGDVPEFTRRLDDDPAYFGRLIDAFHVTIKAFQTAEKPVVAALHGAVAGGGLGLAMATDLAVAAEGTVFFSAYAMIGASPDGGTSYMLPRLVGRRRALEIAMLSERFSAAQALEWGLVNRVVPDDELDAAANALAAKLADGPTAAYARMKALIAASDTNGLEDQLAAERETFEKGARTDDFREGIAAFTGKRPPRFTGR